ncbi:hypothetical protein HY389_01690 [Candidatus Daviesbacteria bacterium]|nr:hypothetical protein [Candidatus Daviesbacteria bacterium]
MLYLVLFLVVIAASFILAYRSMADYLEKPTYFSNDCALYLIRRPQMLTNELLDRLYQAVDRSKYILAFERLFKGDKSALVVYGPKLILNTFSTDLDLLELEDYCQNLDINLVSVWEMTAEPLTGQDHLFTSLPSLGLNDELWWQLVLQPKASVWRGKTDFALAKKRQQSQVDATSQTPVFEGKIRVILKVADDRTRSKLSTQISALGDKLGLTRLPKIYTTAQLVKFYQDRSLPLPSGRKFQVALFSVKALLGV